MSEKTEPAAQGKQVKNLLTTLTPTAKPVPTEQPKSVPMPQPAPEPAPTPEPVPTEPVPTPLELLEKVEAKIFAGARQAAEGCRELVNERHYRARGYDNLQSYARIFLGHNRKWVYEQIRWLEMVEAVEQAGVPNWVQLPVYAAEVFERWENHPTIFYAAYTRMLLQQAEITKESLAAECFRESDYQTNRGQIEDLTYEEWTQYKRLEVLPHGWDLTTIDDCVAKGQCPNLKTLCSWGRGDSLKTMVEKLLPAVEVQTKLKALKKKKQELQEIKRASARRLREEVAQVEVEIQQLEPEPEPAKEEAPDYSKEWSDDKVGFTTETTHRLRWIIDHQADVQDMLPALVEVTKALQES